MDVWKYRKKNKSKTLDLKFINKYTAFIKENISTYFN